MTIEQPRDRLGRYAPGPRHYLVYVLDLEGKRRYLTCEHGVIISFTNRRAAAQALWCLQDQAPYNAQGAVEEIGFTAPGF